MRPVDWEPGTEAKLTYESGGEPWREPDMPVEGDLLASPAGAAYVIEDVRRVRGNPFKLRFVCARLEYGSIDFAEDAEVWPLFWQKR
jgi:hypothetical protein